jgi:hypothetical protein
MSFDHGNLLVVFLTLIISLHRCGESERYVIYPSCGIEVQQGIREGKGKPNPLHVEHRQ